MNPNEIVRTIRKSLGLNQQKLAKELGIAQSQISLAEAGGNETTLIRIAQYICNNYDGYTLDQFFPDKGDILVRVEKKVDKMDVELNQRIENLEKILNELRKELNK